MYKPEELIVPTVLFPPVTLFTCQVGLEIEAPFSMALNCTVCPGRMTAEEGLTLSVIGTDVAVGDDVPQPKFITVAARKMLTSRMLTRPSFNLLASLFTESGYFPALR